MHFAPRSFVIPPETKLNRTVWEKTDTTKEAGKTPTREQTEGKRSHYSKEKKMCVAGRVSKHAGRL